MKLELVTVSALGALSVASLAFAQNPTRDNPNTGGGQSGGNRHSVLETTTEKLNLTPEQRAKVQPIIDQTNPQIQAVRRDAAQKIKTLVDSAMEQIRPMLTPDQQKLLDESQQQRRGVRRDGLRNHGRQEEQVDQ